MSVDIFMCFVVIICKNLELKCGGRQKRLLGEMKDKYLTSSNLFLIVNSKRSLTDFKIV